MLPFEQARDYMRSQALPSREAYWDWHHHNRPKQLPKYPHRAYVNKGWQGWNDFLGNNNVFDATKKTYRPMEEAMAYVHKLKLRSRDGWLEYIAENELPEDIPKAPDYVYDTWLSWTHFLGTDTNLSKKVEAKQIIQSTSILYIVHYIEHPLNIYKIGIERGGKSAVLDKQKKQNFQIVRLFKYEDGYNWKSVVERYGKEWWDDPSYYFVPNIHQMAFEIDLDWLK